MFVDCDKREEVGGHGVLARWETPSSQTSGRSTLLDISRREDGSGLSGNSQVVVAATRRTF